MRNRREKLFRPDSLLIPGKFEIWAKLHLEIYRAVDLPQWASDIEGHLGQLLEQIMDPANEPIIKAREEANLFPVIMPNAKRQREDLIPALQRLQPIWKDDGQLIEVGELDFDVQDMEKIRNRDDFWVCIPDNPYICWLPASQGCIGWPLSEDLAYLQVQLELKHRTEPMICGAWEASPIEFAAMNCVYTRVVKKLMPERPSIRSRGMGIPETFFISFGALPNGDVLNAWFNDQRNMSVIRYVDLNECSGYRTAVRWLLPMS